MAFEVNLAVMFALTFLHSAFTHLQDDVVAFEVNLAVKGDCTIAMWFTDHFAEVRGNSCGSLSDADRA